MTDSVLLSASQPAAVDGHEARETLSRLIRQYQRDVDEFEQAVSERLGMSRTDLRCLDLILAETMTAGTATPTRLVALSGLTPSTVTSVLDRLETAGYVRRVRDAENRRRVFLELTVKFGDAAAEIFGPVAKDGEAQLAAYSDAEIAVLIRFFADTHQRRLERRRRLLSAHTRDPR